MIEWQPIETARKDGTWILLGYFLEAGGGGPPVVAFWHQIHQKWSDTRRLFEPVRLYNAEGYFSPTHWAEINAPPGWHPMTGTLSDVLSKKPTSAP